MTIRIKNAVFVTDTLEKDKYLYIKDDKILALTDEELCFDEEVDAQGLYVSPGFIDIHTHILSQTLVVVTKKYLLPAKVFSYKGLYQMSNKPECHNYYVGQYWVK